MNTRRPQRRSPLTSHLSLLTLLIVFAACRKDMVDQQHLKPLVEENFYGDGRASRAPAMFDQRLRDAPVGYLLEVITKGYGVMYPYASRISPQDRWAIVAHIRGLQSNKNITAPEK